MSSLLARTGRHKQRYQDHLRLVAGCIPYKLAKKVEDEICKLKDNLLVLMISTPNRDDLVFPKGGWEDDETLDEAACREALEEAGVKGVVGENPLGDWEFRSKSSEKSSSSSLVGGCKGYMFALQVTEELDHWPGQSNYNRKWVGVEEAFKVCRYDWMRNALRKFLISIDSSKDTIKPSEFETFQTLSASSSSTNHLGNPSCAVQLQPHIQQSSTTAKC